MLPRATAKRTPREVTKGRPSGRTHEIQRLIGRCMRSVVDTAALGERTVIIDCDVLQADGGTRTASITGALRGLDPGAAAARALRRPASPCRLRDSVAATSVGLVRGVPMLDLCYEEDSRADVDMNVVMTGAGRFVEVQATAEHTPFDDAQMAQPGRTGARRDRHPGGRSEEGARVLIRLYCATGNPGKLREFRLAAGHAPVDMELMPGYPRTPAVCRRRRHLRRKRHPQGAALRPARLRDAVCGRLGPGGGRSGRRSRRLLRPLLRAGRHRREQQSPAARQAPRRGRPHGAIRMRDRAGRKRRAARGIPRGCRRPSLSTRRAARPDSATIPCSTTRRSVAPSEKPTTCESSPSATAARPCGICWPQSLPSGALTPAGCSSGPPRAGRVSASTAAAHAGRTGLGRPASQPSRSDPAPPPRRRHLCSRCSRP